MAPIKNSEPRFPDCLPYLRLAGPICRSSLLREAQCTLQLDVPARYRQQLTGKEIIDLRLMVTIEKTPANEPQLLPGAVVARRQIGDVVLETRLEPKWMKFKGCFINELPIDVTAMAFEGAKPRGGIKCQIEIDFELLGDPRACAVAEFFISRHVEEPTLRRSILAAPPLQRGVVKEKQANLSGSGIDSWIVSLKCPLLSVRVRIPVRFEACQHLECFDLDAFIAMEIRRPKSRCPVCNRVAEIRTLGVCDFTKELLEQNPDCESYCISETSIRAISNQEKEAVVPRKRKRKMLHLADAENQLGTKRERLEVNQQRTPPAAPLMADCVIILDD